MHKLIYKIPKSRVMSSTYIQLFQITINSSKMKLYHVSGNACMNILVKTKFGDSQNYLSFFLLSIPKITN